MKPPGFEKGRPPLPDEVVWLWDAFWDLSSCRASGFGAGPIPWTAIHEYATRYRLTGDRFESFRTVIRRMDGVALDVWNVEKDKGSKKGKGKGRG